jgi:hypothetical protein
MVRHNLVHPSKALEMVFVELARLPRAQGGDDTGWRRAEDRCVRHVSQFRRTSSAAEVFSAVCAAAVEPRGDRPPPSITPIDVRIVPHIQEQRVGP